jgi:hypothetical protein
MMKKLAIMMLTLAASLAAQDYSGIWNGNGGKQDPKYGLVPRTAQMTILQAGTSFTGTVKIGSSAPMNITSGTVNGTQLTFVIVNNGAQITGSLAQNGAQLSGTMTGSNGAVFDFVFAQK